jgi:GNAT superfamily N-acetyltransferase
LDSDLCRRGCGRITVLSTGERFRADLARLICEAPARAVVDEFTSVVDRQIARIGAHAFAKAWRRTGGQVVLLSCHYDILDWVQPDWVFDTKTGQYSGRWLRPRPAIDLTIRQTDWSWWPRFEPHHYLKLPRMVAASCYVGFIDREPVAHIAFTTRQGLIEARACRLVVMPEWQGAGVGLRFLNAICAAWRRGRNRYGKPLLTIFHTSHPGLASALRRDPMWVQITAKLHGDNKLRSRASIVKAGGTVSLGYGGHFRAIQGFRYVEGA